MTSSYSFFKINQPPLSPVANSVPTPDSLPDVGLFCILLWFSNSDHTGLQRGCFGRTLESVPRKCPAPTGYAAYQFPGTFVWSPQKTAQPSAESPFLLIAFLPRMRTHCPGWVSCDLLGEAFLIPCWNWRLVCFASVVLRWLLTLPKMPYLFVSHLE